MVDRNPEDRDGCSFGNAGMIVPSHFVPLAAPGMVALGLRWMFTPKSPFYVRPRLSAELVGWGLRFMQACNAGHVDRAAPLLRDLETRQFATVILGEDVSAPPPAERDLEYGTLTDAQLGAVRDNYKLVRKVDGPTNAYVYEPRND